MKNMRAYIATEDKKTLDQVRGAMALVGLVHSGEEGVDCFDLPDEEKERVIEECVLVLAVGDGPRALHAAASAARLGKPYVVYMPQTTINPVVTSDLGEALRAVTRALATEVVRSLAPSEGEEP